MAEKQSSQRSREVILSTTKSGMIGCVPPHPLLAHQVVAHFEFFGFCKSPTALTVVRAGFARR